MQWDSQMYRTFQSCHQDKPYLTLGNGGSLGLHYCVLTLTEGLAPKAALPELNHQILLRTLLYYLCISAVKFAVQEFFFLNIPETTGHH